MGFPVEMRRKARVAKTEEDLKVWLDIIEQGGYSMVDKHMRVLVPHSCFQVLKSEEREEDRLIILSKEFHNEYDFLEEGCLQKRKKRTRGNDTSRENARERKRIRIESP
ncbi:uncharacterized protein QYS62_001809 [Fusarium acuminatum]|uniref:Uncharacterized protein n=1 Tax=Fusarium acuminatum TaxID=5515 RepID=A0ABZ2WK38_9HYPO